MTSCEIPIRQNASIARATKMFESLKGGMLRLMRGKGEVPDGNSTE